MEWVARVKASGVAVLEHSLVPRGEGFSDRLRSEVLRLGPPVMLVRAEGAGLESEPAETLLRALEVGESLAKGSDVVVARVPVAGAVREVRDGVVVYVKDGWVAAAGVEGPVPKSPIAEAHAERADASGAGRGAEGRPRGRRGSEKRPGE